MLKEKPNVRNTWPWNLNFFIINELEVGAFRSLNYDLVNGNLNSIICACKHLSHSLELAKKIEMIPIDMEAHVLRVHEFMKHAEIRVEKIRKLNRNRSGNIEKMGSFKYHYTEERMNNAMLTISNLRKFSSETFYQVSRLIVNCSYWNLIGGFWDKGFGTNLGSGLDNLLGNYLGCENHRARLPTSSHKNEEDRAGKKCTQHCPSRVRGQAPSSFSTWDFISVL